MKNEKSILIVDDEQDIREVLRMMFERKNWEVIEAEEGFQALELYEKHKPSVILTDINMPLKSNGEPGLSGLELINRINEEYNDKPTIFVISGNLDNKQKIEKIENVASYFEKPNLVGTVDKIELKIQG